MHTIINMPNGNRRRAVIYVSTGLAGLPRDVMSAHRYRRNYNPCFIQPLFGGRLLFLDWPQVGKPTWGYDYTTAIRRLPSPSDCHHHRPQKPPHIGMRQWRGASPSQKNRRKAVIYVSTGLACLPRDAMSAHCYRRNYNPCFIQPLFGGRLLFLDWPQVGKPTWGYDYTTAIRRLPSPSDCHHHRPQKTAEVRLYMLARGWLAYPVTR